MIAGSAKVPAAQTSHAVAPEPEARPPRAREAAPERECQNAANFPSPSHPSPLPLPTRVGNLLRLTDIISRSICRLKVVIHREAGFSFSLLVSYRPLAMRAYTTGGKSANTKLTIHNLH